jgi:hypothetical protein
MPRPRTKRLRGRPRLLIAFGVIVFLGISALLARWLSVENVERHDIGLLLAAEAHGDGHAMLAQLRRCDARCAAIVLADARRLKRAGNVQILAYQSQTAYSLTSTTGDTRVAWKSSRGGLPVVQCVRVERRGNAISGLTVALLGIFSIGDTADC